MIERASAGTPIGELVLRPLVRIPPRTTLAEAARAMRTENVASLVVDTQPPSLLTERDLVRAMADERDPSGEVITVAARQPVWAPRTLSVLDSAALMVRFGLRHLVVAGETGEPVGVLSMRDALGMLLPPADHDAWLSAFGNWLRAPS